jgi:hypothetical protein
MYLNFSPFIFNFFYFLYFFSFFSLFDFHFFLKNGIFSSFKSCEHNGLVFLMKIYVRFLCNNFFSNLKFTNENLRGGDSQNLVEKSAKKLNISLCLDKCRELFFIEKTCCDQQKNYFSLLNLYILLKNVSLILF